MIKPEIDAALSALSKDIGNRPGGVFYSAPPAFASESRFYILGLNPGGNPDEGTEYTISRNIAEWRTQTEPYSAYVDEEWENKPAGEHGLQPRIRHLAARLGIDLRHTPSSNIIFVKTRNEAALAAEKAALLAACWPVHQAVIESLNVKAILCLGGTAGRWTRERLGAHKELARWSETNNRGWTSWAHGNDNGRIVFTLTHPSIAAWNSKNADPCDMILEVLG